MEDFPLPARGLVGYSKHNVIFCPDRFKLSKSVFRFPSVSFQNWTKGMLEVLRVLIFVPENWSKMVS